MNIERKPASGAVEQFERETEEAREVLAQMAKNRTETFQDPSLDDESRIQLTEEADVQRAKLIAEHNKLFNEYSAFSTEDKSPEDVQAFADAVARLQEVFDSKHYELSPGMEYADGKPAPDTEPRFRMTYEGGYAEGGTREMQFSVFEPVDQVTGHRKHMALVRADQASGELKVVVVPEGIWQERPRTLLPASDDTLALRKELATGLARWMRPVEYNPQSDDDSTVETSGEYRTPPGTPIELFEEKDSTLMARTRTIYPGDKRSVDEVVESLVESWDDKEREILEEAGGGDIALRLFAKKLGEKGERYEELENVSARDLGAVRAEVDAAFAAGANSITIKCKGSWVERPYRNLPPGTSPRTHVRRMKAGAVLVLTHEDRDEETIGLQKKFNDGGLRDLDQNERSTLARLLQTDEAELEHVVSTGIVFKDGTFSPHPSSGPTALYFHNERSEEDPDVTDSSTRSEEEAA